MKYIKIIAIVLIVGIVLLTGCAEETETKPKEEKQKEYYSEEGRFSIEYLTDWTMETISDPLSGIKFKDPKDENAYFFVLYRPKGEGSIMRPLLLMALLNVHQSEKYEASPPEIVTISGEKGNGFLTEITITDIRMKAYFVDLTYGDLEYWVVCCSSKESWENKYWPIFNDTIESITFD